jgi:hypothetical protein
MVDAVKEASVMASRILAARRFDRECRRVDSID